LKHFPGYGNNRNTHDDVAHDYRPIDYLRANDLIPFKNAVNHNVPWIMISHNIYHSIDEEYPASISAKVHELLRKECNFSGIATTDSLSMGAIEKYAVHASAGALAIKAGNDIILTSNLEKHINQVIKAVEDKEIDEETIHIHARRVIAWKLKYLYKYEVATNKVVEPVPSEGSDKLLYILLGSGIGLIIIIIIVLSICYYKQNKKAKEAKATENEEEVDNPNENILVRESRDSSTKTE
jgi:beta-glucosidase-like glycosyl hydrolase